MKRIIVIVIEIMIVVIVMVLEIMIVVIVTVITSFKDEDIEEQTQHVLFKRLEK